MENTNKKVDDEEAPVQGGHINAEKH